jgi:hypothetical protein
VKLRPDGLMEVTKADLADLQACQKWLQAALKEVDNVIRNVSAMPTGPAIYQEGCPTGPVPVLLPIPKK